MGEPEQEFMAGTRQSYVARGKIWPQLSVNTDTSADDIVWDNSPAQTTTVQPWSSELWLSKHL